MGNAGRALSAAMRQIALPLDELRGGGSQSLIITESNAQAFAALGRSANWSVRCAILTGPARSGKSLMANYFTSNADGTVIDDAEKAGQEALFNAWNRAQEDAPLLLVSRWSPGEWEISLPDLRSRLGAALAIEIGAPDDQLLEQLIQKHLTDRGAAITLDALNYVRRRISRSHAAIEKFARDANALALAESAPINLSLVRKLLD